MNLVLIGITIFVIVYLFLNWFTKTSSKKIALTIKKIIVYLSLIIAAIFTIGGKFIFSLPFLFVILSGLKIKGLTALQMFQLWRLIQFLKNSGKFSQGQFNQPKGSSSVSLGEAYKLLGLQTYFTAGVKEVRAWTTKIGATAPQAAGAIHTDFEKGFIKAEVISYVDYINFKGELKAKEAGKMKLEGKDYLVKDGDVMHFRFNV